MSIINNISALREELRKKSNSDNVTIGFVPTMGFLHEGHMSLIKRARKENDIVVVSIFVNPTQFAQGEDLDSYPSDLERDYKNSLDAGADIVFNPSAEEMYLSNSSTFVIVEGDITNKLCGKSRPTHFRGVTTVVAKLFNIVNPNRAYFGQKDAQQVAVIQKMVRDLNFDIDIVACELVRESDGLALSSRNVYLSEQERNEALIISKSLFKVKDLFLEGERDAETLKDFLVSNIKKSKIGQIDYVELLDASDLSEINVIEKKTLVAIAVKFGKTRLIDNIYLEV